MHGHSCNPVTSLCYISDSSGNEQPGSECDYQLSALMPIGGMIDTIICRNICNGQRIDAFKATHVVTILFRVRTALMMRVDAAVAAKIVLGCVGVELIQLEVFNPFDDTDAVQWHRGNHGAFTLAERTVTTPRIDDAIRKR